MSSMSRGSLPDGSRLQAVADALGPLREVAAEGGEEAMALHVDLGDREVQAALDAVLEQVGDALRTVEVEAGDQAGLLSLAARQLAGEVDPVATEPAEQPAVDEGGPR